MTIPTFRDVHEKIATILRERGGLGVVLVDLGPIAHIERSFGGVAFQSLRAQIDPVLGDLLGEMKDKVRQGDLLARDEREGDRFLSAPLSQVGEVAAGAGVEIRLPGGGTLDPVGFDQLG